jgi:hypothetical protein
VWSLNKLNLKELFAVWAPSCLFFLIEFLCRSHPKFAAPPLPKVRQRIFLVGKFHTRGALPMWFWHGKFPSSSCFLPISLILWECGKQPTQNSVCVDARHMAFKGLWCLASLF